MSDERNSDLLASISVSAEALEQSIITQVHGFAPQVALSVVTACDVLGVQRIIERYSLVKVEIDSHFYFTLHAAGRDTGTHKIDAIRLLVSAIELMGDSQDLKISLFQTSPKLRYSSLHSEIVYDIPKYGMAQSSGLSLDPHCQLYLSQAGYSITPTQDVRVLSKNELNRLTQELFQHATQTIERAA